MLQILSSNVDHFLEALICLSLVLPGRWAKIHHLEEVVFISRGGFKERFLTQHIIRVINAS